jgi:hypothetical protein
MPRDEIRRAPGVDLVDDVANNKYPQPSSATKKDNIECGRMRQSIVFGEHGLDLFVCGDQLLRGAALNAVLIAEYMRNGDAAPPTSEPPKASFDTSVLLPAVAAGAAGLALGMLFAGKK